MNEILALVIIQVIVTCVRASDKVFWYESPAADGMNEALPIGNGRIGGLVYGHPGNLIVDLPQHKVNTQYKRALDIGDAVTTVQYESHGVQYKREYFVSHVSEVLVGRLTADKGKAYTGRIELQDSHKLTAQAVNDTIEVDGNLVNGLRFAWKVLVQHTGGSLKLNGAFIEFNGCDALTLIVSAGTDYVFDDQKKFKSGEDPAISVNAWIKKAADKSYESQRTEHLSDFHSLFNRVDVDLGQSSAQQMALPTDKRKVEAVATFDPDFEEMFFQFGRYLMISSSRTSLPANLQGLWNDKNTPSWHSDYHADINVQMNYWPAETTNLGECHLPLFNLIRSQLNVWRKQTRASDLLLTPLGKHSSKGVAVSGQHNIYGGMGLLLMGGHYDWDKTDTACYDTYAQHFWEHYAFGLNKTFLKDVAYPYLKEVSEFWDEQLKVVTNGTKEQLGKLVVPHGWSPEHGPVEDGCSYNQEIVWDLYTNYVKAVDVLGVDKEFRDRVAGERDRLLWPGIGSFGQLMEWMEEQKGEKTDHHRHTSHLFGVYPGNQFNWETTPTLANASLVSLNARGIDPKSEVKEWSFAWRTAIYARLRDAENAYHLLRELLSVRNTCPNMFGLHPPMQIDGNFGITAAVAEMLVQSHAEVVELLPALPREWTAGHAKGLRARGGHQLDIYWANHTLNNVLITSLVASNVKLKFGNTVKTITVTPSKAIHLDHNLNPIPQRK
ncbi:unnamed protein product [Oppiella nova]|uniref:Glycosyl hydrolase family 95 N-terminal domain-containing protein n=1 Tax=Oppiella nova TaxID=334625 RepID=A0A7R9MAJ6_9ACAR|nr:unnamed protein product [Oppiella nova]CAG2172714.1 unnamed protein product [Oppiella nova]